MKKLLIVFIVSVIAAAGHGAVLAYEGFGNGTDEQAVLGYSGTSAESGFAAGSSWTRPAGTATKVIDVLTDAEIGIQDGYTPETTNGSEHLVRSEAWSLSGYARILAAPINLSADGTYYLSFFAQSGNSDDFVAQIGLYNGTNAILAGQAYSRGLNATWGAITTSVDSGNNQIDTHYSNGQDGFYLVTLVKTNSASTNDLAVTISWWHLTTSNIIISGPEVSRTQNFTGVTGSFDQLAFKIDGWAWIDELRIADTVADATGGIIFPPLADDMVHTVIDLSTLGSEIGLYNGSFEIPVPTSGTFISIADVNGWDGVNGGSWDGITGTQHDTDPYPTDTDAQTDGDRYFQINWYNDGPVWNVDDPNLPTVAAAGETYTFYADVQNRYSTTTPSTIAVVTDDDPNIALASKEVYTSDKQWNFDEFISYMTTASDIGKKIGFQYARSTQYSRLDHVRLFHGYPTVIEVHGVQDNQPDGTSIIDNGTNVDLTWTPSNDPNLASQTVVYYISNGTPDIATYNTLTGTSKSAATAAYNIGTVTYDQWILWRVDSVLDTGEVFTGTTYIVSVKSADFSPTVDAGSNYITWIANLPLTLAGQVDDLGEGDILDADVVWSIASAPSGSTAVITKTSSDPLNPTAGFTTDIAGDYVIQLAAADTGGSQGVQSDTDTLTVRVAADACAAKQLQSAGYNKFDNLGNRNCIVDMADFAVLASQWLDDISLTGSAAY